MVRTWRAASMAEEKCTQKLLTKIWRHEMSLEVIGVVGSTLLNGYKVCRFFAYKIGQHYKNAEEIYKNP